MEIEPKSGVFDYAARYTPGMTSYYTPARLADSVAAAVAEAAVTAHRTLGLRDLSRVDLIVRPDGTPEFLEVNVAPGMTETSMTPMAIDAAGSDVGTLCADLLRQARDRWT